MGEIAEMMLEGILCEGCGVSMVEGPDDDVPGFPVRCPACCNNCADDLEAELNGEPDDDLGQWTEHSVRQVSMEKRANNRAQSTALLEARGISFENKNRGAHLIVRHADRVFDFWPGTGKYMERGSSPAQGRGVFNLLKELQRKRGAI